MTGLNRWLILAGAAAVVVILFFVFRGGDENGTETTAATTAPTATTSTAGTTAEPATTAATTTTAAERPTFVDVRVRGGKVVGGPKTYDVPFKGRVVLTVTSDVADEVHVHGYDLMKDVAPGGTVKFSFVANLSGTFEFELEDAHQRLGELSVASS